jgi:hypothetical protein
MKRTFISLGVAFLVAVLVYFGLGVVAPDIYVEKALNILVAAFVGSAVITAFVLGRWGRNR